MTTTTHTPGPWATYINGGKDGWIANAEGDLIACAVRDDTMEANARLIAAAPDLLAALEAILPEYASLIDDVHEMGGDSEWAAQAKSRAYAAVLAIVKAKGD